MKRPTTQRPDNVEEWVEFLSQPPHTPGRSDFVPAPVTGVLAGSEIVREAGPDTRTRRYLVFASSYYYPTGGWNDCLGSADTIEAARAAAAASKNDWSQIIDLETGKEVE